MTAVDSNGNLPNSEGVGVSVAESVLFVLDGILEFADSLGIEDIHWEDVARVFFKNKAVKIEGLWR